MKREKRQFKFSLHSLLYNNKFVMIFSIFIAFIIWAVISVTQSPIDTKDVGNVNVVISMKDSAPERLGLQAFGQTDYKVSVRVEGKKYEINALTPEEIEVTAQTNSVGSAGMHTLKLSATCDNRNIRILSLSQDSIEVYFDTYKEAEYTLVPEIIAPNGIVPDGYTYAEPVLSSPTVTLGGAAAEVNKIDRVLAQVTIDEPMTQSPANPLVATIRPVTSSGEDAKYITVMGGGEFTVGLQVLKIKEVPTTVNFLGAPATYASGGAPVTVTPAKVRVAGAPDTIDAMDKLVVGTVDFSRIGEAANRFTFKASDISGFQVLDDVETFTATVDVGNVVSTVLRVPDGQVSSPVNAPEGYTAQLMQTSVGDVTIVGPQSAIALLDSTRLYADVDMKNVQAAEGVVTVNVSIRITGDTVCWAHGTYSVQVRLVKQ